jgi:hypothetical protein
MIGSVGTITITDGTITATGGTEFPLGGGAGIGSGYSSSAENIEISGGTIGATGGHGGAGIGGGGYATIGTIYISGGNVEATGGHAAAGIGDGARGGSESITISGGIVEATAGDSGAGIGGAIDSSRGPIAIHGGTVTATGSAGGAGIGGGNQRGGGNIEISGGTVSAISIGNLSTAIGGGRQGAGGIVFIHGMDTLVNATGNIGNDIGSGYMNDEGGSLTVDRGATVKLNKNGTNAETDFITGTIGGVGAGLYAGIYQDRQKLITLYNFLVSPENEVDVFDLATLSVMVDGLSYDEPQGSISFKANGEEIGLVSITRNGLVADGVAGIGIDNFPSNMYTFTAEYVQNEDHDSYYTVNDIQINDYIVNKIDQDDLEYEMIDAITYGDDPFMIEVGGGNGTGAVSFERTSGNAVHVDDSGTVTVIAAGSAEITVNKAGDDYYHEALPIVVEIDVSKAIPSTTFPTAGTIPYGQALGESELIGGSENGSFVWQAPDTFPTVQNAGYRVRFTPNDTDNYFEIEQVVSVPVTPVALKITANNDSKEYGTHYTFSGIEFTAEGLLFNDTVNSVTLSTLGATALATVVTDGYEIEISEAQGTGLSNYHIIYINGTLTIEKINLIVTADDKSKVYGQADPLLTASYVGLVDGEDETALSGSLLLSRTSGKDAGSYPITPSGLSSSNYIITFVDGTLAITPKGLMITAVDKSKVYGEADPDFTVRYAGFVSGEDASVLGGTLSIARTAGEAADSYVITPSGLTSENYDITFVDGTLTVIPKVLTVTGITVDNKVYDGTTAATLRTDGAKVNGVIGHDKVTLDDNYTALFDSKNVGRSKTVTVGDLGLSGAAGNYTLIQPSGLTADITPKPLIITGSFNVGDKVYDGLTSAAVEEHSLSLRGVILGDHVTLASFTVAFSDPDVEDSKILSISAATLGGSDRNNYTLTLRGAPTAKANIIATEPSLLESGQRYLENHFPGINISSTISDTVSQGQVSAPQKYTADGGKDIVFVVHWAEGQLKFSLYDPDGQLYQEVTDTASPIVVEVKNAKAGIWSYTVTGVDVPYDQTSYVVLAGEMPAAGVDVVDDVVEGDDDGAETLAGTMNWPVPVVLLIFFGLFILHRKGLLTSISKRLNIF